MMSSSALFKLFVLVSFVASAVEGQCWKDSDKYIGDLCYSVSYQKLGFSDAALACHGANQNLAVLRTTLQDNFLASQVGYLRNPEKMFWIGLSRASTTSRFQWDDGTNMYWSNFDGSVPKDNLFVAESTLNGKWQTLDGQQALYYVCSYDPRSVQPSTPGFPSGAPYTARPTGYPASQNPSDSPASDATWRPASQTPGYPVSDSTGKYNTGYPSVRPSDSTGFPASGATWQPASQTPGYPASGATWQPASDSTGRYNTGYPSVRPSFRPSDSTGFPASGATWQPASQTPGYPASGATGFPASDSTGFPASGATGYPASQGPSDGPQPASDSTGGYPVSGAPASVAPQ